MHRFSNYIPNAVPISLLSFIPPLVVTILIVVILVVILIVSIIVIYYMKKKQAKKSEYDYHAETYSLPSNPNAIDDIVATPNNPAYGVCPNIGTDVTTSSNPAYGVCPILKDNQMTTTSAIYEDVQ